MRAGSVYRADERKLSRPLAGAGKASAPSPASTALLFQKGRQVASQRLGQRGHRFQRDVLLTTLDQSETLLSDTYPFADFDLLQPCPLAFGTHISSEDGNVVRQR